MILLVDIGNSRIKMASCDRGQLNVLQAVPHDRQTFPQVALDMLAQLSEVPHKVVVANVAARTHTEVLADFCERHWGLIPHVLTTPLAGDGITNGYTEHQQLGIDRWAAMVGAWRRYQGLQCIIDAGSAVTIDVLARDGIHQGGVIIPGVNMILNNIVTAVDGINEAGLQDMYPAPVLGRSTRECLLAGGYSAVIGAVERVMAHVRSISSDNVYCVITGGAAQNLLSSLPENCICLPNLVLEGMMVMAEGIE